MEFNDIEKCVAAVEATRFEQMKLWEKRNGKYPYSWEEDNGGFLPTVGYLADMPVVISIVRAKVEGKWVIFWHPTSVVVDHRLIDKFFEDRIPGYNKIPDVHGDCMNFHNTLHYIRDLNKQEEAA